ncbi:MAG: aminopeptidase P family protein [Rhodobacteraceae bacterium]|nr:aminopeptidase P family protein [Paracoccaceae bacterium]
MTDATTTTSVSPEEFAARRAAARNAATEAGFDGLLVCSRGGGTLDRYADAMYLANFYSPFPYIPDLPGSWTGRGHAFLVLPATGDPALIVDVPNDGRIALPDACIIRADRVLEATVAALKDAGLAQGRIGIVGHDVLSMAAHTALAEALPGASWAGADAVVGALRAVKSPAEVEKLRRASQLGSRMIEAMMEAAVPGALHGEIVAAGTDVLIPAGGMLYNSFMASGRGGAAPKLSRANFPTWGSSDRLEEGDWFRVGISGVLDGYAFDLARSRAVGPVSARQIELFEAAMSTVEAAAAAIRPGATAGEVARAGLGRQQELGFSLDGVFSGMGHGIGLGWDSPWLVPDDATPLVPGMVLCLERTVTADGHLGDFEETVLVTDTGAETITDARQRWW